jgi:hypothetical protein
MNWKTVKRYKTFEEADKRRNELVEEGQTAKVRRYVNKTGERFEVKVPATKPSKKEKE